jgi:oligopeptide transport system ATP-binding protein
VTIQAQIVDLVRGLKEQIGMAIIWITHDLGVVAGLAERVIVMYAGYIVEEAEVHELYEEPHHPYTLGLLRSVPRLDMGKSKRLIPIDGLPPDLIDLPPGCPFAPRCQYRTEKCTQEAPPIDATSPTRRVACWNWETMVADIKEGGIYV